MMKRVALILLVLLSITGTVLAKGFMQNEKGAGIVVGCNQFTAAKNNTAEQWQRYPIKGYNYSYELPSSFKADYNNKKLLDFKFSAVHKGLITGVMIMDVAHEPRYKNFPRSLEGLTESQREKTLSDEVARFQNEWAHYGDNIYSHEESFVKVNGNTAIKFSYIHKMPNIKATLYSVSHIFSKDGNYISFDFTCRNEAKEAAQPIIERSIKSIRLVK